ncbi:MAG: hypothetical protein FJ299_09575 [Planctomycetes bacterium]|nr:hypothetical protein [Planctomycetota bacterium]
MIRPLLLWLACSSLAPLAPQEPPDRDQLEQRMRELVRDVERNLRAIDVELSDAAAGETALVPRDSGLSKLLEQSRQKSSSVVRDIDEILELAAQLGQSKPQGGGGSGRAGQSQQQQQGQPEQNSAPRRDSRTERERTPERGQQPTEPEGQEPRDGQPQPGTEQQLPGPQMPPRPPGGTAVPVVDTREAWGELPDLVREVFHAQGSSDMPLQYREWIDGYWERLREQPR